MKLQQLIESPKTSTQDLHQGADQIVKYCQPYLQQGGGLDYDLFRGTDAIEPVVYKAMRSNRTPLNTSQSTQQLLDQWFIKKFGHPYRSSGIYTTGDRNEAAEYGDVYRIFPIGQFSFVWSPKISDLYVELGRMANTLPDDQNPFASDAPSSKKRFVEDFLEKSQFINHSLEQAAKSEHEVVLNSNYYFAVNDALAYEDDFDTLLKERIR